MHTNALKMQQKVPYAVWKASLKMFLITWFENLKKVSFLKRLRAIQAEKLSFSCEFRWESSNETNIDNFQTPCHQMYGNIWDFSNNLKKLKMWHFFDEIFTVTRYWKWKPISFRVSYHFLSLSAYLVSRLLRTSEKKGTWRDDEVC